MADIITCNMDLSASLNSLWLKNFSLIHNINSIVLSVDVDIKSNKVLNVDITISTETLCPGQGPVSCWKLN